MDLVIYLTPVIVLYTLLTCFILFISRKFLFLQKFVHKKNILITILISVILSILISAFKGAPITRTIPSIIGSMFWVLIPSIISTIFFNRLKFVKKDFVISWFYSYLVLLVIMIIYDLKTL